LENKKSVIKESGKRRRRKSEAVSKKNPHGTKIIPTGLT